MGKIKSYTELISRLKVMNYDVSEFDYVEGKTKDSYVSTHPLIYRGKRFYENPYLWEIFIDDKLTDIVDYIIGMKEFKVSYLLIVTLLNAVVEHRSKFAEKYLDILLFSKPELPEEIKENEVDRLLVITSQSGEVERFNKIVNLAVENNIKPRYNDNFACAGEGKALFYASKADNDELANYLLDNGADPTMYGSMAFGIACKIANYPLALRLANEGADIHSHHDLGKIMILRNDSIYKELSEESKQAREELLKLYETKPKEEEKPES